MKWLAGGLGLFLVLAHFGVLLTAEQSLIGFYQRFGSPLTSKIATCRYSPSCSNYALESLHQHGFWKGNVLIAKRLSMCSPVGLAIDWYSGTDFSGPQSDPVPLSVEQPSAK